jgi:hypothetical protein
MKIAIMQPYFMPYIGYFQLINAVDKFVIYDDVNYINRGWVNRNKVLINGKSSMITVPLKEASQNKLINEIEVYSNEKWKQKMLKTIELAYKKAPHLNLVYPLLNKIINNNAATISEFNFTGIKAICDYLGITTSLVSSSEMYANNKLKGQYRILDICIREKANHYINPTGGMELYSNEVFSKEGISLSFIISELRPYKQFKNEFIPALSLIDVMMFNSTEEVNKMLNQYQLI